MTYKGRTVEFTADGKYRPNSLIVDGELYTMAAFDQEHGYNWKATANGNELCYRSETGKEFRIMQAILTNDFMHELYDAYKATGKSQRELAEMIEVPKRTFEDWINGKRIPTKITQEAVLAKIRNL